MDIVRSRLACFGRGGETQTCQVLQREKRGVYFVQGVTAAAPKGCQQQQYRNNDRALRTHAGSAVNFPRLGLTQLGRAVRRYTYARGRSSQRRR